MKPIEFSKKALIFAAFWPFMGALLHLMAIFGGYSWYEFSTQIFHTIGTK